MEFSPTNTSTVDHLHGKVTYAKVPVACRNLTSPPPPKKNLIAVTGVVIQLTKPRSPVGSQFMEEETKSPELSTLRKWWIHVELRILRLHISAQSIQQN